MRCSIAWHSVQSSGLNGWKMLVLLNGASLLSLSVSVRTAEKKKMCRSWCREEEDVWKLVPTMLLLLLTGVKVSKASHHMMKRKRLCWISSSQTPYPFPLCTLHLHHQLTAISGLLHHQTTRRWGLWVCCGGSGCGLKKMQGMAS